MISSFQNLPQELKEIPAYTCEKTYFDKQEKEKCHTKQLLNTLNNMRKNNPATCCGFCKNWTKCDKIHNENMELIKNILSTREHIPNKKESKQLRKERIKRGV